MKKNKLFIHDNKFAHSYSSSGYNKPENFEWSRSIPENHETVFVTDVYTADSICNKKINAWLIEPRILEPQQYDYIEKNPEKFHKVFTYDKVLLDSYKDKCVFIPAGGCWIEKEKRDIHAKNKLLSMVISRKNFMPGHKLRHNISNSFKNIDYFGPDFINIPKTEDKTESLKNYMFQIVIESCQMDYYFTEKIIDCFATGTVPIYWGCPSIKDFFDINGIITFNNIDELKNIIKTLDIELYRSKTQHMLNNFDLCRKYMVPDNLIYEYIKK